MKAIIHVNRHRIRNNKKNNKNEPVFTIKTYKGNTYAHKVLINGPCELVYKPEKPLSCGAVAYIIVSDHTSIQLPEANMLDGAQKSPNCTI